jgi:predicted RNA-binding Zn ribbon-like protein
MQFNTYTVAGAQVAAWLANHPAAGPDEVTSLLDEHDVHDPVATELDVAALRPWGNRLREAFEAGGADETAARLVDALLIAADCRPRLVRHGPGLPFHLHYAPAGTHLAGRVMALTAGGLAHVIDEGEGSRLRACARDGCGVVFLDTSRNGRRVFCAVRCANQVNVASHRRRRRAVSVGAAGPADLAAAD